MITLHDRHWLNEAFQLALKGLATTRPNPRVGAILVSENRPISEGWHYRAGSAHAEVMALKKAADKAKGATLYVTLEPCSHQGKTPPCVDAIIESGVARLVYGCKDPNPKVHGDEALKQAGIEVEYVEYMSPQLETLNYGFLKRMKSSRPFVKLKMAISIDGRITDRQDNSKWITGQEAREHVHKLRNSSCAILTGIGTVNADDPALTVRHAVAPQPPLRVVLDNQARMSLKAHILSDEAPGLWVTSDLPAELKLPKKWQHLQSPDQSIDLHWLLQALAEREINEVLVEAGGHLAGALLDAGLVDEIWLYQSSKILGDKGQPAFRCQGQLIGDDSEFSMVHQERLGQDQLLVLSRGELCSQV